MDGATGMRRKELHSVQSTTLTTPQLLIASGRFEMVTKNLNQPRNTI
jgi:hypothetical protein